MLNKLTRHLYYYTGHYSKFCIIGGGTAGLNTTAHLIKNNIPQKDITIFQPNEYHYYQPAWTMVGAGMMSRQSTRNPVSNLFPQNSHIIKQKVLKIIPQQNTVITQNKGQYKYDHLIIASGFKLDWDKIKGAQESLNSTTDKVCSIYDYRYLEKTKRLGKTFQGGNAIFSQPLPPIKCAGAPQKILYLWTYEWKKLHLNINIQFYKASAVMFSVPKYSQALSKIAEKYGINIRFKHNLIQIKNGNVAVFQNIQTKQKIQKEFDFLHVTPPMSPHDYIKQSGLANKDGYVDVDKYTLKHLKYDNIWSLGDCSSLPNSKTAAAIFQQTLVLVKNILSVEKEKNLKELPAKYQGYASCPLFVGGNKLMLAQFGYDGKILQSFYNDQQKPRRIFYYLKRYIFPFVYWKLVPRGLWKGRKGIKWF